MIRTLILQLQWLQKLQKLYILFFITTLNSHPKMSEQIDPQAGQQAPVPEDPEYQLEEHIAFKRKQQIQNSTFKQLIVENLSQISLVMDGSNFALTRLNLRNKGIQQITEAISSYPHLRNIDIGFNQLQQISYLEKLKFVVQLNLENNLISDIKFLMMGDSFPYLKKLNLQGNKITALNPINLPNLVYVNFNKNKIVSLDDFQGHPKIQVLELRKNRLTSLKGLANLPSLKELYLADNQLTNLHHLSNTPKLAKIHARKNKIQQLVEFPQTPSLKYLNLRQNLIKTVDSIYGIAQSVQILNLLGCPISQELGDNTKKQVWMRFRHYERINKSEVGAQEKLDFDKEYKDRLAEQERQRLEKEAAQREAQLAAQNQA